MPPTPHDPPRESETMKFIDRAFLMTLAAFTLGAGTGVLATLTLLPLDLLIGRLIVVRLLEPVQAASTFGSAVLVLLIFANNAVAVFLSFLYPLILGKVRWTPTPSARTMQRLLAAFSVLIGFLIGFFNLGATLGWAWESGGWIRLNHLLAVSWLHVPIEFLAVLICVAEPLRIMCEPRHDGITQSLRSDLVLLVASLIVLLGSAAIEVLLRV